MEHTPFVVSNFTPERGLLFSTLSSELYTPAVCLGRGAPFTTVASGRVTSLRGLNGKCDEESERCFEVL